MGKENTCPKEPQKGDRFTKTTKNNREVTFEATGKDGFGKWKIVSNKTQNKSEGASERY